MKFLLKDFPVLIIALRPKKKTNKPKKPHTKKTPNRPQFNRFLDRSQLLEEFWEEYF